jgi:hypothetical protein
MLLNLLGARIELVENFVVATVGLAKEPSLSGKSCYLSGLLIVGVGYACYQAYQYHEYGEFAPWQGAVNGAEFGIGALLIGLLIDLLVNGSGNMAML